MNNDEMGMRIKQCRKAHNITQEKLAEMVDISPHYLYEIERGTKSVSLSVLADITIVLHTSLDYLVLGLKPAQPDFIYTDELNELLNDLSISKRSNLCKLLKSLMPYLNL